MNHENTLTWPDCDKDPEGCFEKFLLDKLKGMEAMGLKCLRIGDFDQHYSKVFHKVADQVNGGGLKSCMENSTDLKFWWNVHKKNIGTVKDKWVYKMDLFYKHG